MFRWQQQEDQSWLGMDGASWYHVVCAERGLYQVTSNARQSDFENYFRLDWGGVDTEQEIIRRGPELEPYILGLPGLRLLAPADPNEAFFGFLCSANNHLRRILPMVRRLGEYGPQVYDVSGWPVHAFPAASVIAEIPELELRAKGFGYRAATITRIAAEVALKGEDWLFNLKKTSYAESHARLVELKGIGPKLADCICLFGLHHMEAVPIDTHIWQAFTRLYHADWRERPLSDVRYRLAADQFRARFGNLSGWAHQYLFYENVLSGGKRRKDGL